MSRNICSYNHPREIREIDEREERNQHVCVHRTRISGVRWCIYIIIYFLLFPSNCCNTWDLCIHERITMCVCVCHSDRCCRRKQERKEGSCQCNSSGPNRKHVSLSSQSHSTRRNSLNTIMMIKAACVERRGDEEGGAGGG